jgi:hypothetical protein
MSGDYTRFTHKPEKRYSAVLMQQGRVQLDADWNEQVEILKRRWEIQAKDTFGECAVPISAPGNEGAFAISNLSTSPPYFTIGAGHMYVDGRLVENFADTTYQTQPFYFPDPTVPLPLAGAVAYLDVWEREITYIQDRELLEKALSGVDTATRLQTVWQVKTIEGNSCRSTQLPAPSAGRLSSRAIAPPASDDPCLIAPGGGYRGLENRLYRVEIHTPGSAGDTTTIRFKWSREHASVVSSVEKIEPQSNPSILTVSRIGRDKMLRFQQGDWVEILDDNHELMEHHGEMAQITNIDEANRQITLDRDIAANFPTSGPDRHLRLIRWDQTAGSTPLVDGLVAGSDNWVDLEDGVQVQLSFEGLGGFHAGDYWVFAARTADGSVEELTAAPPRGIIHHYCPLAEITGQTPVPGQPPGGLKVVDCRDFCAPCGRDGGNGHEETETCCVELQPDGNLQDLVNSLIPGGCIRIPAGVFTQATPITISDRHGITIQGCSHASQIRYVGAGSLFTVQRSTDIIFRDFAVNAPAADIFHLRGSQRVRIEDCLLQCHPETGTVVVVNAENENLTIEGCHIASFDASGAPAGPGARNGLTLVDYRLTGLFVRHNHFDVTQQAVGAAGEGTQLINAHFEANTIRAGDIGLDFSSLPARADVVVARNFISTAGIAIKVTELQENALLRLAENRIGQQELQPKQGVVVEQMQSNARLMLDENQVTTAGGAALRVEELDAMGEVHVNANIFRRDDNLPVILIGAKERAVAHILFSNNQVYTKQRPEENCTVELNASRFVVMGNYVADEPLGDFPEVNPGKSICLLGVEEGSTEGATAVGNVTRNGVSGEGIVTTNIIIINNARF